MQRVSLASEPRPLGAPGLVSTSQVSPEPTPLPSIRQDDPWIAKGYEYLGWAQGTTISWSDVSVISLVGCWDDSRPKRDAKCQKVEGRQCQVILSTKSGADWVFVAECVGNGRYDTERSSQANEDPDSVTIHQMHQYRRRR